MGNRWQEKRKNEHFYKKAKKEGYRGRAAYKLSQLNDRFDIISKGDVVVDLGSAPGSWLQITRDRIGEKGYVLGVDLENIENLDYENVETVQADINEKETKKTIKERIPEQADALISDASPNITGTWEIDHARSIELCESALDIADEILKENGNFLAKVFQGEFFKKFLDDVGEKFDFHKASKPKASRDESAEMYVIGKGYLKN